MRRDLNGSRILITGASGGIGRAIAAAAADAGARLLLTGRSAERLDAVARELAGRSEVSTVVADITRDQDQAALIAAAGDRLGGLDVLVNNAGIGSHGHFSTSTEDVLRQIMEVNFFAPAELMRRAIPVLERGRQPAIVNVASMCGRCAMPAWPEYSASKFALVGLADALRAEMARFDIRVLTVLPGLTRSNLGENLLRREGKMKIDHLGGMPTEVVGAAVIDALRRDRSETVVGSDARWMLRVQKFFPRWLDRRIARRVRQLYADSVALA
jgi:short-subunit dehydrogenase